MHKYKYKEAVSFLNNLYWHDSVLHEIRIVRTNSVDHTVMVIDLINDSDEYTTRRVELSFRDCYYVEAKMFGGVDAISDGEMISKAEAVHESMRISEVVKTWSNLVELSELIQFSMTLSSTDSIIRIIFKHICIDNVGHYK